MHSELELRNRFIQFLKEIGYSDENIISEYKLIDQKNVKYIDLVIVDETTKLPLMIFEFQREMPISFEVYVGRNLRNYTRLLGNGNIRTYAVAPIENEPFFEVYDFNYSNAFRNNKLNNIFTLRYENQKNIIENANIVTVQKEKKRAVDNFSLICWLLASILILVMIPIKYYSIEISSNDIIIVGGILALIIMPFANKIKFWGIEFERQTRRDDN